jgi:hypothetical protein
LGPIFYVAEFCPNLVTLSTNPYSDLVGQPLWDQRVDPCWQELLRPRGANWRARAIAKRRPAFWRGVAIEI